MTKERAVEILNLDLDILGQYGDGTAEAYKMAIKALEQQPCEDCISREAVIRLVEQYPNIIGTRCSGLISDIKHLPSVTPINEDTSEAYIKGYDYGVKDWFKSKTQPCEDCIRRQAVIILIDEASEMHPYKVVGDSDTYSNYNQGWSDACDWLYANIEGVPSVTPQRPKGKWIEDTQTGFKIRCSECGARNFGADRAYCPRCGRQMKEDSND